MSSGFLLSPRFALSPETADSLTDEEFGWLLGGFAGFEGGGVEGLLGGGEGARFGGGGGGDGALLDGGTKLEDKCIEEESAAASASGSIFTLARSNPKLASFLSKCLTRGRYFLVETAAAESWLGDSSVLARLAVGGADVAAGAATERGITVAI